MLDGISSYSSQLLLRLESYPTNGRTDIRTDIYVLPRNLRVKGYKNCIPETHSSGDALYPSCPSSICMYLALCVYSNSRNDVLRVAQRYGTIAAHTRRRASVLIVFVVFCVHMNSFAGLIKRTPPPTFSDTAITDRHSDTTIFQLRAHWVRISWSIGSELML